MNYREYMRECIKSPVDGTSAVEFGKWAILNQEQRKMIGRLLDEMDRFDEDLGAALTLIDNLYKLCKEELNKTNNEEIKECYAKLLFLIDTSRLVLEM